MHLSFLFIAAAAAVAAEVQTYHGYKVYRVTVDGEEQAALLKPFEENPSFDFWSGLRKKGPVDIMVSPQAQTMFEMFLDAHKLQYELSIHDVESVINVERQYQLRNRNSVPTGRISFTQYNTYSQIESYLEYLQSTYPDIVTLQRAAISTEGRNVTGIIISSGGSVTKPIIMLDGGIHAREWIAPAMALYVIQELVENTSNRYLLNSVDWHIIPVVNPDGYEYTHTTTRLWRKTRKPGLNCVGVDGNRNFDFHWMGSGASDLECSEIYAGPEAFSEPETRGVRDWVAQYGSRIKVYVAIHSYGNYILYPWGYTSLLPDDWLLLHNLGLEAAAAIRSVAGTSYVVGSSTNVLYAAAGGADDYVKGVGGVAVAYTFELPGGGSSGFDLPPSRILPVVVETWESFKVFHNYAQVDTS